MEYGDEGRAWALPGDGSTDPGLLGQSIFNERDVKMGNNSMMDGTFQRGNAGSHRSGRGLRSPRTGRHFTAGRGFRITWLREEQIGLRVPITGSEARSVLLVLTRKHVRLRPRLGL